MIKPSETLKKFLNYSFAEVDRAKQEAIKNGYQIIDLGVGDPSDPMYDGIIEGLKVGAEKHARTGYPPYIGHEELRVAIAEWLKRRFGIDVDSNKQIVITSGSKEAIFHFPMAFLNQEDKVLIPSIGYPPYRSGTMFAGGIPVYYSIKESNGFLPNLEELEFLFQKYRPKIMWLNYPNNPTTAIAGIDFYQELIALARKYDVILASDEAYIDIYYDVKPVSILQASNDWSNLIAFHSLSKRNNATGLRVGFVVGGEEIVKYFAALKTQMDSGVANVLQEGALRAFKDDNHAEKMRQIYAKRRALLKEALESKGIRCYSFATIYIWAKTGNSVAFTKKLLNLDPKNRIGINVTPGKLLALDEDENDADQFVRFALVANDEHIKLASEIIKEKL
ncbi:MAG TPA: aminotransferase class I/II-fold pyridoxal phosphate-dependent enzyme [Geobacterales bacterium]|nr:aminotransferase class I/II-fold pyridoxal phosphate-dependent enzyme [Geobacterales bacterium]